MKRKESVWLVLGLAFLSIFMIAGAKYGTGGCDITGFSMSPEDPYVVGDHVRLEGTSTCGTVRFEIDGQPKAEIGQTNQGEWWKTEEFGSGNYNVCFVARGNTDWANANRSCRTVYVEGGQAPPPGSNPGESVKCWINTFSVSPDSVPEGETVHLSGQGQCDGNAQATRFTINGTPYDEFGGHQNAYDYRTAGKGTYRACIQLTAGNWESDAAVSCVNFTVTASGSSSGTGVIQGDQNSNNEPGQTDQSGSDGNLPNNGGSGSGSCDNPTYNSKDYFSGWMEPGNGDWAFVPSDIDVLRLRDGKDCDSAVYGYVAPSNWYPVLNENAVYVKIKTKNGTVGWIMKSYVRVDHNRQAVPAVQPPIQESPSGNGDEAAPEPTPGMLPNPETNLPNEKVCEVEAKPKDLGGGVFWDQKYFLYVYGRNESEDDGKFQYRTSPDKEWKLKTFRVNGYNPGGYLYFGVSTLWAYFHPYWMHYEWRFTYPNCL